MGLYFEILTGFSLYLVTYLVAFPVVNKVYNTYFENQSE